MTATKHKNTTSDDSSVDGDPVVFETHPSRYRHIRLAVDGPIATLELCVNEQGGHREDYTLKLNSYDISVDVELADAVQRLRFEHPEVACVVITSGLDGIFSAGANILMLRTSSHSFKVNFCKFTNETRLAIEDSTHNSGQTYIAALNGLASGGGYELPLACEEIYLVDDRRSAVSLPEIPSLAVLPGTGGLTRLVDKRNVRRDRADVFATLTEGLRGQRAVDWNLVDGVFPSSRFDESVTARARKIADRGHPDRRGIALDPIDPTVSDKAIRYRHVELIFGPLPRTASLKIQIPNRLPEIPTEPTELGAEFYALRVWREIDDALLRLRFHYTQIGLVLIETHGDLEKVLELDTVLHTRRDHWYIREVTLHIKRVLKRMDVTSRSFFALIEAGSCFAGSFWELALASDRSYMAADAKIALSELNAGPLAMANGLTRLQTRFLADPSHAAQLADSKNRYDAETAEQLGLVTAVYDDIDWEDEIRMVVEERASYSPDALTGMEASLRFAGPETLETKIFGRLSAWQNWCFQRPNAVGAHGALELFGEPKNPAFDWQRV